SSTLPSQLLLHSAEEVVHTLQELLKWLMGIPAGLKLNFAFNKMLGKFFVYHINLWWTFLVLAEPVLDFIFFIFLCFGRLGLTFQAAILADLLALASFHVYCIYVYAARLYNLQISGLLALWRLFLGRKKNPLRGRVDSCEYTANQLFIASLHMQVQTRKSGVPLVLSMTPVRGSLWKTIKKSIPDPVKKPSAIMWGSLLKSIVTGQLIYPM
ncbi:N-acetylglucosaminyl-phosphatidylinositol biosynthetic protein gpi1, partial [Gryllus bimaculatus]